MSRTTFLISRTKLSNPPAPPHSLVSMGSEAQLVCFSYPHTLVKHADILLIAL